MSYQLSSCGWATFSRLPAGERSPSGGQVTIRGGARLETGQLIAEGDFAFVDHEQSEYADGESAARDLLGFGAVDADDARALRNGALEGDLDVLERARPQFNTSSKTAAR